MSYVSSIGGPPLALLYRDAQGDSLRSTLAFIFAVGHVLTIPHVSRLAVFFPALLFGWLRARTGGIGAGVLFHAMCNLFSAALARGYLE